MGYGDYYWGLYRTTIYRDPFPHSLLKVLMAVQNQLPKLWVLLPGGLILKLDLSCPWYLGSKCCDGSLGRLWGLGFRV